MRMDQTLGRDKPFASGQSHVTRLIVFLVLSIVFISLDQRGEYVTRIRSSLSVVIYPLQIVATIPGKITSSISGFFDPENSYEALEEKYNKLSAELPLLHARLQRFESLESENKRLRLLLESAQQTSVKAIVAELLEVHPDPYTQTIVINRGSNKGVFRGQPVIDAHGIMGQVTRVSAFSSTVTLLTDPGHAIPVMVRRTGLRTIVTGGGADNSLSLPYLTADADLREGDDLISSGMGGRFPPGYPVGQVISIKHDPNVSHTTVKARPAAQLNHYKEVLLIWPQIRQAADTAGKKNAGDKP